MKGLITAGGRGTRMRPLTFATNKHFIPLANKPLLFYAIETLVDAGIKKIGINYNPGQLEEIKSYLGTGQRWGAKFTYLLQEKPAGLADILRIAHKFVGQEKVIMHLGDNIFWGGIKDLVRKFEESSAKALLVVLRHPENQRMGVPYFDRQGKLKKVVEKPKRPPNELAVPGLYFFDPIIFNCFSGKGAIKPSKRGELEIVSVYNWLIRQGEEVAVAEFTGVWKDPGKFNDWIDANRFILDISLKSEINSPLGPEVKIEGRVKIGSHCQIHHTTLRGPITIADRVKIENSFIGPYTSIGNQCQIKNAQIENSVLMPQVAIDGVKEVLDSCLIGQKTVIKAGQGFNKRIELFLGHQCLIKL